MWFSPIGKCFRIVLTLLWSGAAMLSGCQGEAPDTTELGAWGSSSDQGDTSDEPPRTITVSADVLAPVASKDAGDEGVTCEPGEYLCTSETEWVACDPDGQGVGLTHTCASTAVCDPAVGVCQVKMCEPGAVSCADWQTPQTCNALGTRYEAADPCSDFGVCVDGACEACWAGEQSCTSLHAVGQCTDGGDGFVEGSVEACPEEEVCRGEEGACVVPVCTGGAWRCSSPFTYQICNEVGSSWQAHLPCPEKFVCIEETCEYAPCIPTVLFVVDRSGSMEDDWAAVKASVHTLVSQHEDSVFGLLEFPSNSGSCGTSSVPQVSFAYADTTKFDAYFDETVPQGPTPLVDAMERVSSYTASIFGAYAGSVVVLSDGVDTCADEEINTRLSDAVTQLNVVHGIHTYVIGYNFFGDTTQLDVMAAAGGTSYTTHLVAGDEASLTEAFQGVVDDIKLCTR